jgi:hypothetical protein
MFWSNRCGNLTSIGLCCAAPVTGLMPKDELDMIINDIRPIMKAAQPGVADTWDNLYAFFLNRVRDNLHVILCFSPVGNKFSTRAQQFPGLINGCTIDWFLPWPEEALTSGGFCCGSACRVHALTGLDWQLLSKERTCFAQAGMHSLCSSRHVQCVQYIYQLASTFAGKMHCNPARGMFRTAVSAPAAVAVSGKFIDEFKMACSEEDRSQLKLMMGHVHVYVTAACKEYFDKFRRHVYVTPKSYLSFIQGYKELYSRKWAYTQELAASIQVTPVARCGLHRELWSPAKLTCAACHGGFGD